MLAVPSMHDKTVAVLGLGRSGLSVCRALAESGARTWAWDDAYERRASAAAAGTPIVDLALCNWARVDRLVLSPGIAHRYPRPHRLVRRARAAGVEVVGDIELLAENQPKRRIAGSPAPMASRPPRRSWAPSCGAPASACRSEAILACRY